MRCSLGATVCRTCCACSQGCARYDPLSPFSPPLQIAYLSLAVPPAAACTASWGPAAVSTAGAAALLALTTAGVLPASWQRSWDVASWTATLLFMLEPLAALVRTWGSSLPTTCSCLLCSRSVAAAAAWLCVQAVHEQSDLDSFLRPA